jgi:spermidine synthase
MTCHSRQDGTRTFILCALFVSGANGLVFEIVFRRQLLLALGVTHYSVGTVLTVFMAGLALGSFLFGRLADKTRYPLRLYGGLEVGIGLSGILLSFTLPHLDLLYAKLHGVFGDPGSPNLLLKSSLAGTVLLFPTVLMGGTLPVVGKALVREGQPVGSPLGLLYGVNTLGGVVGVLGATFWLLGRLGATWTLCSVSIANVLIGATALWVFGKSVRLAAKRPSMSPPQSLSPKKGIPWPVILTLVVYFTSGFAALSLEVHWTRILAYVVGSHGYAFGIILAAFLSGIALGSLLLSRLVDRFTRPMRGLGATQILISLMALGVSLVMFKLRGLTGWLTLYAESSWDLFIVAEMVILFILMVIPTFLMGAVFPLVMAVIVRDYERMGASVGLGYALNTVGSIVGAFFAGFVLIPYVGISQGLRITLWTSLGGGIAIFCLSERRLSFRTGTALAGLFLGALVFAAPLGYPLQGLGTDERLIFYEESSAATVAVRENSEGARMLSINGLDEVPVDSASLLTFRVLAHLPLLMHHGPRNIMVLSLGGAITTGSVACHPVEEIDAVELCSAVVQAATLFTAWNHGVLEDPRLSIIVQDGRNYLLTTDKRYDVITADATHPWSADSWILYTREMYQLVRSHLSSDGIFCQWVPLHWMSQDDFKCILRTIRAVFPEVSLWYTGSYVIVVASKTAIALDPQRLAKRMDQEGIRRDLATVGVDSPFSLLALHLISGKDIDQFLGKGPLNTDDLAYLEHAAARCFGRETTPKNLATLADWRNMPASLLSEARTQKDPDFLIHVDRIFRARARTIRGRIATYKGQFLDAVRLYQSALQEAPEDGVTRIFLSDALETLATFSALKGDQARRSGDTMAAWADYRKALELDPTNPRAHNGIGLIHFSKGRYEEALKHFDIALNRLDKQVQIRTNRVLALLKLQRFSEASQEIARIEQLETGRETSHASHLRKLIPSR